MNSPDDEDTVRVNVEVPQSVRDTAKKKLGHGGISKEVRNRLREIAFGPELNQRSRLERQRQDLADELRGLREERRGIDSQIETVENRIDAVDDQLASLSSREEKFEAKVEELESRLRRDGVRIDPEHPAVVRAAATGGVEPEGVLEELKERNPDVPDFAFEDGLHDYENQWNGVPEEGLGVPPEDRERRYR